MPKIMDQKGRKSMLILEDESLTDIVASYQEGGVVSRTI